MGLVLVKALAPDRLDEFVGYYRTDRKRKSIDVSTYSLQDHVSGVRPATNHFGEPRFDADSVAYMAVKTQLLILASLESRIDGVFADLEGRIIAEFEDRELQAARGLLTTSVRAAGTLAGVVLESHLAAVANTHAAKTRKKAPGISDYNELLKREGVIDIPTWRKIQFLGDIRNLCSHKKEREPTKAEVQELLEGVATIVRTVF